MSIGQESEEEWSPPSDGDRWGEAQGLAMAKAYRRSGLTAAEFAQRHGIGVWRVRRWARVPRVGTATGKGGPVRFAPVRLAGPPRGRGESRPGNVEVVVGPVVVRVGPGFDADLLRRVVAALGTA